MDPNGILKHCGIAAASWGDRRNPPSSGKVPSLWIANTLVLVSNFVAMICFAFDCEMAGNKARVARKIR